jgi:hypothetical protein
VSLHDFTLLTKQPEKVLVLTEENALAQFVSLHGFGEKGKFASDG